MRQAKIFRGSPDQRRGGGKTPQYMLGIALVEPRAYIAATRNDVLLFDYYLEVTFNGCTAYDTVTVYVDNPPTASNPAPIAVQCAADVPAPDVTVVTDEADDITIPPTVTFVSDVSDGLSCPETITRTYRVTDGCGSFVDVVQTITVNDTQAPVLAAAPGAVAVQCPDLQSNSLCHYVA